MTKENVCFRLYIAFLLKKNPFGRNYLDSILIIFRIITEATFEPFAKCLNDLKSAMMQLQAKALILGSANRMFQGDSKEFTRLKEGLNLNINL